MKGVMIFYCDDFVKAGFSSASCCISCHEDSEEFGMELIECYHPIKKDVWASICCKISNDNTFNEDNIEDWERLEKVAVTVEKRGKK